MLNAQDCVIQGEPIPAELLGELTPAAFDANNSVGLQKQLLDDGYLFFRRLFDVEDVMAVRDEVFGRLAEVGEIKQPVRDGIFTGTSCRRERTTDLGQFWQSVSEGPALRRVSHGKRAHEMMDAVFGETSRPHDYMFLRPSVVGRSTHLHYDFPFFARGSKQICTVWTPLGEIPPCDGTLVIVEGSHRFDDLIESIIDIDYSSTYSKQVSITESAVELARHRHTRLLTAHFQPGDVVIFGMTTLHGTLDNHSPIGRTRLSSDVRWQPSADPIDPRYMGPNPPGTTGAGYAELNGAKPLDVPWHVR
ncbi:MAG: phytanoyl-CoA dioxygenase family protein [Planctomycetota bacterium]|nr:phytanoyl-CoA dioxygenase family protein [Planctomycetota bacterium]MDA1214859.1 phytanoyl-CoA dioxygenase family protein [Planctomycetota bacterium]